MTAITRIHAAQVPRPPRELLSSSRSKQSRQRNCFEVVLLVRNSAEEVLPLDHDGSDTRHSFGRYDNPVR